jgi:hypothetical protein
MHVFCDAPGGATIFSFLQLCTYVAHKQCLFSHENNSIAKNTHMQTYACKPLRGFESPIFKCVKCVKCVDDDARTF